MPRRLYDFKCDSDHTTEKFIDVNTYLVHCPICGGLATRAEVNAHSIPVGVLGPNWVTDRAKKQAKERSNTAH
jgi:hypothetical protein